MKGYSPTKNNAKFCDFRYCLLSIFEEKFAEFLIEANNVELQLDETKESRLVSYKTDQFATINFFADLYLESIVSETHLMHILFILLGIQVDGGYANDRYVRAAL